MRRTIFSVGVLVLGSLAPARAQTIAITNARIHTMTGAAIERGTVVVVDGRIQAVGVSVAVPSGARVIDAAGKTVTPGLFDSSTALGIVEIGQVAGTADASTTMGRVTAAFNVADGLNPFSTLIPITRVAGITRAVVSPQPGSSLIAGQGIVIDLGSERASEMVRRNPVAMYAVLGERGAALAGGARGAALLVLREALQDARDYAENRRAFEEDRRRAYALSRLDLEALGPVVRGELPLVIEAHRASDLLAALRLAREFNLRLILSGATEAWMVASEIAQARVPVVINPMQNLPAFESLGITLENAARLHAAGVTIAFGSFESHNARNLKQLAGNAVAHGLPHDAALRAMTIDPARIWGIDAAYGTIEPGKEADLVIWSGDPLELTTQVEQVFIRGREMPKDNRQRLLFERYRRLPR
jgi:imidazolonepropionase-like amidohydrolase